MLPPHQQLVARDKWPLVGERAPSIVPESWELVLEGLVEQRCCWNLAELGELPQVEMAVDIHCVTRWSKLAVPFGGVLLKDLLSAARPLATARFVSFEAASDRGHATSLPLADAIELGTQIALRAGGAPLAADHGGPLRVVVPGRYFYKSLKWLRRIELLAEDRLGYWESHAGYHNTGDPWREQRYVAEGISKAEATRILSDRDIRDRTLLGIAAAGLELPELVADRATLRNADFSAANLTSASFRAANLSNASFVAATLQHADFTVADVEGADFTAADLRGADFSGASLFGATFIGSPSPRRTTSQPHPEQNQPAAIFDATTRIDPAAVEMLTPLQQDFVRRELARHASPSTPAVEES